MYNGFPQVFDATCVSILTSRNPTHWTATFQSPQYYGQYQLIGPEPGISRFTEGKQYRIMVEEITDPNPPEPQWWCVKCRHKKHGTAVCGANTGPASDPGESQCDCTSDLP